MSFPGFINSTKSYEFYMRSSGLLDLCNKRDERLWTIKRSLYRGIIIFIESFCKNNQLNKKIIFKELAKIFKDYSGDEG